MLFIGTTGSSDYSLWVVLEDRDTQKEERRAKEYLSDAGVGLPHFPRAVYLRGSEI